MPEKVRLTRTETQCIQWLMNAMSNFRYAEKDLEARLKTVPDGAARLHTMNVEASKLFTEIAETIPDKQRGHILNIASDMEVRLMPKMMPRKVSVVLTKEEAMALVDAAQVKCRECTEWFEDSEKCPLRQVLECVVPLEKYDGLMCPYNMAEWEDRT